VSTPTERVREYLRQSKRLQDTGGVIHSVHTDPESEAVSLTVSDLEDVLEIAEQYEMLCD
jgi:hypothetical protein